MKLLLKDTSLELKRTTGFLLEKPFPLTVVDNFLPAPFLEKLLAEISCHEMFQRSNDYIFAKNKFESPRIESLGDAGRALYDLLLSPEFSASLSQMYGSQVFIDPEFVGGGLHRGGEGSYLDMHVDFGLHPGQLRWVRELNILLYLNKDWEPNYGGCLDLKNGNTGETRSIEPLCNRLVIMQTKDFTFHGYKPISFPKGLFRTSIAAYAYSLPPSEADISHLRTTTKWAPEGGGFIKSTIAAITPPLVAIKQRLLGSSTAKKGLRQK